MNSAGQGRNRFAVSHLPAQFGAEDFSYLLPKPPISQIFCRISGSFAAQSSVCQNCNCRNLDAELIDFIKDMKNFAVGSDKLHRDAYFPRNHE
jgi:hypothetical protein